MTMIGTGLSREANLLGSEEALEMSPSRSSCKAFRDIPHLLSRSNTRHVVVFAQSREILVQLLHTLLVSLHALALESLIELYSISTQEALYS